MKERITTMHTRISASILAAALLATTSLMSCGGSDTPTETTTGASTETTTAGTTSYYDTLDLPNFNGETFTILCRTDIKSEVYSESENGEVVNDAVYLRNLNVQDRLGATLEIVDVPGDWANKDSFIQYVSSSILSNDDAFQLILGYMNYMPPTILDGLYLDINTLPNINLDNPWWVSGFNDNVTINGKMYMAMGDMCWSMLQYAFCGYANKTVLEQYNYSSDDLYAAVREGRWTFDMMNEMAANVTSDLNGDSVMDANDLYGIGMHNMPIRALTNAFAIDYTTRDSEGLPQLAVYGERLISAYEEVYRACNSEYWYTENDANMFMNNQMLFYFDVLHSNTVLREMESDYCVLPMPKYDEAQDGYRTETVDTTSVMFVPVTVQNKELCGWMLELLNYESSELIVPAYFDMALQSKYARDESSIEMMQIIRDSIYYDFGYVFAGAIGAINGLMEKAMTTENLASEWEAIRPGCEQNLTKLLDFFRE